MSSVKFSVINLSLGGTPPEYEIGNQLAESADHFKRFSVVPEITPAKITKKSILIVVGLENKIEYVGILRKSQIKAATAQRNFKAVALKKVDCLIDLNNFPLDIQRRVASYFQKFISHIPEGCAKELLEYFQHHFPDTAKIINKLIEELGNDYTTYSHEEIVQLQARDATTTAISLWGDDEVALQLKSQPLSDKGFFLDGLDTERVFEDHVISHDWTVFSDWDIEEREYIGSTNVFEKDDKRLAVINANRTNLEQALGCDLIYIDLVSCSVIFIQYKMLSETNANGDAYFNPNSGNHNKELAKMRSASAAISKLQHVHQKGDILSLRLNECAFYFKLCGVKNIEKSDSKIAKGMYIPLDFWEQFLVSTDTDGPNGGKQFGYFNLSHKYLHATHFAGLFKDNLIGTKISSWKEVSGWIKQLITEQNRSAVIAISERIDNID